MKAPALLLGLTLAASASAETPARANYLLNCGGCHGFEGVSNAVLVPNLQHQVGYFLNLPEGRDYLARLPNVAFSTLNDRDLADMMNFIVFTLGEGSVPKDAKPFSPAEIGRLRQKPLTEVPLFKYRAALVDKLIATYAAPDSMRVYGTGLYPD
jgi:mono/diheme cytochrome c family protein